MRRKELIAIAFTFLLIPIAATAIASTNTTSADATHSSAVAPMASTDTYTVPYTQNTVTIDGNFTSSAEWEGARVESFWFEPTSNHKNATIYIHMMHDRVWFYLFFDVVPDNSSDSADSSSVWLDVNNDEDFNTGSPDLDAELWGLGDDSESIDNAVAEWDHGFGTTPNNDSHDHRTWEWKINMTSLTGSVSDGDVVGFYFYGYGTLSPGWNFTVGSDFSDETTWGHLSFDHALGNLWVKVQDHHGDPIEDAKVEIEGEQFDTWDDTEWTDGIGRAEFNDIGAYEYDITVTYTDDDGSRQTHTYFVNNYRVNPLETRTKTITISPGEEEEGLLEALDGTILLIVLGVVGACGGAGLGYYLYKRRKGRSSEDGILEIKTPRKEEL